MNNSHQSRGLDIFNSVARPCKNLNSVLRRGQPNRVLILILMLMASQLGIKIFPDITPEPSLRLKNPKWRTLYLSNTQRLDTPQNQGTSLEEQDPNENDLWQKKQNRIAYCGKTGSTKSSLCVPRKSWRTWEFPSKRKKYVEM